MKLKKSLLICIFLLGIFSLSLVCAEDNITSDGSPLESSAVCGEISIEDSQSELSESTLMQSSEKSGSLEYSDSSHYGEAEKTENEKNLTVSIYSLDNIYPWSWADSDGDSGPGIDINVYSQHEECKPTGNTSIYLDDEIIDVCPGEVSYLINEARLWQNYTGKGTHTVNVVYPGDDNFNPVNETYTFNLSTYFYDMTKDGALKLSLPSYVSGILTVKANGTVITTKNITATYATMIGYCAETYKIELDGLKNNATYNIQMDFKSDSEKYSFNETFNYTKPDTDQEQSDEPKNKKNLTVVIYSLDDIYPWSWADSDGDSGPGINIYVYSESEGDKPKGYTIIYLDGEVIDVHQGEVSYLISEERLWQNYTGKGTHTVTVVNLGDNIYNPVNETYTFNLAAYCCGITEDGTVELSLPSDVSGVLTVKANGKNIITKNIKATYASYMTYRAETFKIRLNGLEDIDNKIEVIFKSDQEKYSFKESFDYTNADISKDYGESLSVNVSNIYGKPVGKNQAVKIKIAKKTFSAKTDKNGLIKFKIPNTITPGKYKITITYKNAKVSKKLTVKQILSAKSVKIKKSAKKLVLTATLKKSNGKYLKGKTIKFKIQGKTYKAKTNKKGIAKVTVKKNVIKKLKKGKTYSVKVSYLNDQIKSSVKVR